jgi:hypothetical protein
LLEFDVCADDLQLFTKIDLQGPNGRLPPMGGSGSAAGGLRHRASRCDYGSRPGA